MYLAYLLTPHTFIAMSLSCPCLCVLVHGIILHLCLPYAIAPCKTCSYVHVQHAF